MADEAKMPWWKRSLFVAMLGAVIPVATFVQGWLQKERELALQEQNQLQQFRAQYMTVLAEAGVEGIEVLADFIADTEPNPKIREWAAKQRQKAVAKIADLDRRSEEERKTAAAAEERAEDAAREKKRSEEKVQRVMAQAQQDRAAKEEAVRQLEDARKAQVKADATVAVSAAKLARTQDALRGMVKPAGRVGEGARAARAADVEQVVRVRDHRASAAEAR